MQGGDIDHAPLVFESERDDLEKPLQLKTLISLDVDSKSCSTQMSDYCAVQFLGTARDEARKLCKLFPGVRLMAGSGITRNVHDEPMPTRSPPTSPVQPRQLSPEDATQQTVRLHANGKFTCGP